MDGAGLGPVRWGALVVVLVSVTGVTACGSSSAPTAAATLTAVTTTAPRPAATTAPAPPSSQRCPADPGDLGGSTSDEAFAAVVRFNERDPDFDPATLRRDSVAVAPDAGARGAQVLAECGPGVAERTWVVQTTRVDLLPAQSAAEGVYFVSRVSGQLVVWEQAH